jgi:hypothetical protein
MKEKDAFEVLINLRNDKRHLWTCWWLREINATNSFMQPFIQSLRLWCEGKGLMGENRRDRVFSGPMLQFMAIHVAMQEELIPAMDQRQIRALKERCDRDDFSWMGKYSHQKPPTPEEKARIVCRLLRSFFDEFKDLDFRQNAVQVIDPLILCDQGPGFSPAIPTLNTMRIRDPWGTRKEGSAEMEPGKNVAAHVRTHAEREYFQKCCREAYELTKNEDQYADILPCQLGLTDSGKPFRRPPPAKEIRMHGEGAVYRPYERVL